jgi:hypothetical protein
VSESSRHANPSVPGAAIDIHEELWNASEDISTVLAWAVLVGVWLLILAALALASLLWPQLHGDALATLYVGGVLAAGTSIYMVYLSLRSRALLNAWDDAFMPFLYAVKFEMLPVVGADRTKEIWMRYKSLWRVLEYAEPESLFEKIWHPSVLKFNAEIKGKKASHRFDVYARIQSRMSLFVRRFAGPAPVTAMDLQHLKEDSEDVLKKTFTDTYVVGAFSSAGYTNEALSYAKSEKSLVREDIALDVMEETPTGFKVLSVEVEDDTD